MPDLPQDEHKCLNLNVFVPPGAAADAHLPVMEFIYGGAFLDGSNALPFYDGTYLAAKHQAIIVVINYRLGILGGLFMTGITDGPDDCERGRQAPCRARAGQRGAPLLEGLHDGKNGR